MRLAFTAGGNATVTFEGNPQDGQEDNNSDAGGQPITFPGVVTMPDPYDGQFAQVDVLSATLM